MDVSGWFWFPAKGFGHCPFDQLIDGTGILEFYLQFHGVDVDIDFMGGDIQDEDADRALVFFQVILEGVVKGGNQGLFPDRSFVDKKILVFLDRDTGVQLRDKTGQFVLKIFKIYFL